MGFLEPFVPIYNWNFKHFNRKDFNKKTFIFLQDSLNKIIERKGINQWKGISYLNWSKISLPIDYENDCPDWKQISQKPDW